MFHQLTTDEPIILLSKLLNPSIQPPVLERTQTLKLLDPSATNLNANLGKKKRQQRVEKAPVHEPTSAAVPSPTVTSPFTRAGAARQQPRHHRSLLLSGFVSSPFQMERSSSSGRRTSLPPPRPQPAPAPAPGRGVCMMSTSWRDKQHPNFVNFIAAFLAANSYRLNFLSISPDFIFNNGGLSVAFIFETSWDCGNAADVFSRVNTLKRQFKNLYVVVAVPTVEQIESFNRSYFQYGMEFGCPTFVPVNDSEMGFEKMLKIAHARGVCKQQDISSTMRNEREQAVQSMDAFLQVLTSIPGIDGHDASMLAQAIGSIEAIAKASKGFILENTDLSTDKAETVVAFFRDPQYYLSPKIN